jgi:hypothetical protein
MDDYKPDTAKLWREKMAEFRACGVERVGILSSRLEDCCREALKHDSDETIFKIDDVPQLPLKGCASENCMCILYAKP